MIDGRRISINESYTDVNELEKPIAMFEAVSNVADPEIELFELLRGKSAMTNSEATFKLSQKGNQAFLYRLLVNYEAVPMYYLTIRVKNKQGGEAETVLQVDVVDNNDEVIQTGPALSVTGFYWFLLVSTGFYWFLLVSNRCCDGYSGRDLRIWKAERCWRTRRPTLW